MLCAGVPVIFGVLTTDNLEQVSVLLYFFSLLRTLLVCVNFDVLTADNLKLSSLISFVDFACLCDLWCADDRQPGAVENDP